MKNAAFVILLLTCCMYAWGGSAFRVSGHPMTFVDSRNDALYRVDDHHHPEMDPCAGSSISFFKDDHGRQQLAGNLSQFNRKQPVSGTCFLQGSAGLKVPTGNNSLAHNYPSHTFW